MQQTNSSLIFAGKNIFRRSVESLDFHHFLHRRNVSFRCCFVQFFNSTLKKNQIEKKRKKNSRLTNDL